MLLANVGPKNCVLDAERLAIKKKHVLRIPIMLIVEISMNQYNKMQFFQ